jgi:poly(3-hydroxybutyrate) depolymerase
VPPEEGAPLVFVFHGIGGSADGILEGSMLPEMAQELGFALVVPEGFVVDDSALWNVVSPENEDVAFFDDMLTCVKESVSIDDTRVYVTGHSNGGLFTSNLIRLRSEVLAAAAPISGGWFVELEAASRPIPTLVTWGGVADQAFEQDFNRLSLGLIDGLKEDGHVVVSCDHGQGHGFPLDVWPWLVEFLLAHEQGQEASPFAAGALPERFADYCEVVSP